MHAGTPSHSLDVSTCPSTLPHDMRILACFSNIPVNVCVSAFMHNTLASSDFSLVPRLDLNVDFVRPWYCLTRPSCLHDLLTPSTREVLNTLLATLHPHALSIIWGSVDQWGDAHPGSSGSLVWFLASGGHMTCIVHSQSSFHEQSACCCHHSPVLSTPP